MSSKLKSPNRVIVLRHYRDRAKSKYFVGNYLSDFERKIFGPLGGFVHFTIRNFHYELHTASARSHRKPEAGDAYCIACLQG